MSAPQPELKVDVVLPAAPQRSPGEVYVVSTAIGLWTFCVSGNLLFAALAETGWFVKLLAVILWPVIWLLGMVAFSQFFMGLAQLTAKVLHLSEPAMKQMASVLMLAGFSVVAGLLIMDLRVIPGFLGGVWFAGCVVALIRETRAMWRKPDAAEGG